MMHSSFQKQLRSVIALLAIPLAVLLIGTGVLGALHHHAGGVRDANCALCTANANAPTTVPAAVVPSAPQLQPGTIMLPAQQVPAWNAGRRASSRAPPAA